MNRELKVEVSYTRRVIEREGWGGVTPDVAITWSWGRYFFLPSPLPRCFPGLWASALAATVRVVLLERLLRSARAAVVATRRLVVFL